MSNGRNFHPAPSNTFSFHYIIIMNNHHHTITFPSTFKVTGCSILTPLILVGNDGTGSHLNDNRYYTEVQCLMVILVIPLLQILSYFTVS
jgi:hypothetical protein